jgi:hypothetical protein
VLGRVEVAESLLVANGRDLINLLVGELIPEDGVGFIWQQGCFNSRNLLRTFAVIMDGFQLSGKLHALHEGGLAGLQDLISDGVLDSG